MMMDFGSPCSNAHASSTCHSLLKELQQIWTDIGESEADRDRMLLELERECMLVYKRKVEEAANAKARLHQSVAAKEAELATLMAALGELNFNYSTIESEKKAGPLKEQLGLIMPLVDDLKVKKDERVKQLADIKAQIEKITGEISGCCNINNALTTLDLEEDLSMRKLSECQSHLRALQNEKSERIQRVVDSVNEVHSLCGVLGLDLKKIVSNVHPGLHETTSQGHYTCISDSTLEGLHQAILKLKMERKVRYHKLKDEAASLFELWNLMDTTKEERSKLSRITSFLDIPESEVLEPGALSLEVIQQVAAEVERLAQLKASRMKELVMKRRAELEDLCRKIHIEPDPSTCADKSSAMIDSGLIDPCELLENIESQINKAKNEALSRKEIMDRIERWLSACDEENWLEDYHLDHTRYSGGRGAHINLKRAERARITVTKIPAMVDSLIMKTLAWEDEKQKVFLYDGVRLVSILEDYKLSRLEKEEAKKRARDQKKLQDMLLAEKESIYGSRPSPRRSSSFRKANVIGNGSVTPSPRARRNTLGSSTPDLLSTPRSYSGRQSNNSYFKEITRAPLNFVAIAKEDTMSFSSVGGSEPESPSQ